MTEWSLPPGGPFRAFRDRYVARFAGLSYDLAPGAVGVVPEVLQSAPELEGRHVLVTHDHAPAGAFDKRPTFLVVSLTRLMQDAMTTGQDGWLVFSTFDLDEPRAARVLASLGPGDPVYLNSSMDRFSGAAIRRPHFPGGAS